MYIKSKRSLLSLLLTASLLVSLTTASSCRKATLEGGGAYAPQVTNSVTNADSTVTTTFTPTQRPDMELFVADSAFGIAKSAIDVVFKLERDNRKMLLGISPNIKQALDSIRPQAGDAIEKYTTARKLYIANPTPAGLSTLQALLSEAQRVSTSVQGVIAANTPAPQTSPK